MKYRVRYQTISFKLYALSVTPYALRPTGLDLKVKFF